MQLIFYCDWVETSHDLIKKHKVYILDAKYSNAAISVEGRITIISTLWRRHDHVMLSLNITQKKAPNQSGLVIGLKQISLPLPQKLELHYLLHQQWLP